MTSGTPTTRRVGAAALAALTGTAIAVVATPGAATAAPAWSPTATHAVHLAHASLLGAAPAATPLRLTVGLTPRDRAGLDSLIRAQSTKGNANYKHFLTPAQFTSRFAATPASAAAVTKYLGSQGMTGVKVSSNRLLVTANATVAQAQQAFHTSISRYQQAGKVVLANTSAALVPTALAGDVSAVLGLTTLGPKAAPSVGLPKLTGYYPKEFNKVYDSWDTKPGTGTTLAVIAEGNLAPTIKDLRLAEAKQKLPQVPVTLKYAGVKSPDVAGADEWDLDTQTSTGIAPSAKRLYIYVSTSLTDSDLARAIGQFASDDLAKSGSASLGECDAVPFADGAMTVDDIIFAQVAVQGQTFFASSGDSGSSCAVLPTNGVPASGLPDTEYPASSPYVTGVGGTTLVTDDADNYTSEVAWNAGGGGVSPVETAPFWQDGVNLASAAGLRGVPDVAFDADPNTGALIYVDGAPEQIGGTSLSSPLAMGLWTRMQATSGNKLGFASTKLYNYYTKVQNGTPTTAVPGFHDIVAGGNGTFVAMPGYDFTTGLGSWDLGKLYGPLSKS